MSTDQRDPEAVMRLLTQQYISTGDGACGCHEPAVFGHLCHARMVAEAREERQQEEARNRAKRYRELMAGRAEMVSHWQSNRGYNAGETTVRPRI